MKRKENGYRILTDNHLNQIKICRLIFNHPYSNQQIRHLGYKVIKYASKCDIAQCNMYVKEYIDTIRKEIDKAQDATQILKRWVELEATPVTKNFYNRKQAATLLGTTIGTVRNWERNGLILCNKFGAMNEKIFDDADMERLRIIYMLRQTGYSMSAIHRCLAMYDAGHKKQVLLSLNHTENDEDMLSAGDRWLSTLYTLESDAIKIIPLINLLEKT